MTRAGTGAGCAECSELERVAGCVRAMSAGRSANFLGANEDVDDMRPLMSDARIIRDSVADSAVFSALYERHLRAVAGFITRRVGAEIAEDLSAEVFVRAFRGRSGYRDEHETALPWLLGIANNLIADHRKAERRRLQALQRSAGASQPAIEMRAQVLAPELVRELLRLPAADRDALLLIVWGELTYAEAATALGIPVGTIRSRIARARQRLGRALGQPSSPAEPILNGEAHA